MNSDLAAHDVERVAALLKAMGNARRLRILCRLGAGECSVGELSVQVGLGQSALSQHLAKLRAAGLVGCRRQAQTIFYSLADAGLERLIAVLAELYCRGASAGMTAPVSSAGALQTTGTARSRPDG